nr:hypothetical protein [Candidatus Freyarchaeota archaeon]
MNKMRAASPKFSRTQTVKKVSKIVAAHLPLRWLLLLASTLLYLAYLHSLLLQPPPKPGAETAAPSSYEAFAVSTVLTWLLTLLLGGSAPSNMTKHQSKKPKKFKYYV